MKVVRKLLRNEPIVEEASAKTPQSTVVPTDIVGSRPQRKSFWRRLFDHAKPRELNHDAALASQLRRELGAHRFEDLAKLTASRALQAVLASIVPDLPERLDHVARQAEQMQSLQDPGRRLETAEAILRILSPLQSLLLDRSGPIAAAVGDVAASWVDLVRAERDASRAAVEESRDLENPFTFGNPVRPGDFGVFTGRRDIALEIERNILRAAQTPTLLLYGQRRMGKTSILNQLPSLLGPCFLPVTVDCQSPRTVEGQTALLRYLSRCLSNALNQRLRIASDDLEARQKIGAEPLQPEMLRDDAYSVYDDWLDNFQARLPQDACILLCLDEFERLQETVAAGWGARFLDSLRHSLQHRPRFAIMFIGSHTFEQLGPAWTDRFLSARRLKVSFLGPDDVRQLLTRPTPSFRLAYEPEALSAIQRATNGQPFLTQALASELVHHMNRVRRKTATEPDVEIAIGEVLETSGEYFADLWSSRNDAERAVLREIAKGFPQPPVTTVARGLRDYDILNDSGEFAVPLVKRWVQQNTLQN